MYGYQGMGQSTLAKVGQVVGQVQQAGGVACKAIGYVHEDEVRKAWIYGTLIGATVGWLLLPKIKLFK